MSRKRNGRKIIKRIIVRGILVLDTPTCLSSGEPEGVIDMMLLRDSISPQALLTGSSIAGALRNYLQEYENDYGTSATRQDLAPKLFGDLFAYKDEKDKSEQEKMKLKEKDSQSPLIIDDALSSNIPKVELRDGVKINGKTGTADEGAKYDLELLEAGTKFTLSFELLVAKDANEEELKKALAIALRGLEKGEISLGMKKRRGFGRCHVENWQVREFDLRKPKDRKDWLKYNHWTRELANKKNSPQSIVAALKVEGITQQIDQRSRLVIQAKFKLASPLLIRSSQDLTKRAAKEQNSKLSVAEVVHLRSQRKGKPQPIVSGTSLAGVLWHRAERIVNTLGKDFKIVDDLFGKVDEKTKAAQASRLVIEESEIESTEDLVQNRIAIDRFTGGAYHGALFSEQPIFGIEIAEKERRRNRGKKKSHLELKLELRQPEEDEIGLLLLLIKDLWTGDLSVGGTSSIGRGRLQGVEATITWQQRGRGDGETRGRGDTEMGRKEITAKNSLTQPENSVQTWVISENNSKLEFAGEDKQKLENFVSSFVNK